MSALGVVYTSICCHRVFPPSAWVVVHGYVCIVYAHQDSRSGTTLPRACPPFPRRTFPPLSPQRALICFVLVHGYVIIVHSYPGRRRLTTSPGADVSAVSTADLPTAVSTAGNSFSIVIIHGICFNRVIVQRQRRGRVFQPRAAAPAVSTTGLLPIVSTTGVFFYLFLALAARATGRCLPEKNPTDQARVYTLPSIFHRACTSCPPVVSSTGNSFSACEYTWTRSLAGPVQPTRDREFIYSSM